MIHLSALTHHKPQAKQTKNLVQKQEKSPDDLRIKITNILEQNGLSPAVAKTTAKAYSWTKSYKDPSVNSNTIAVVNFSQPSNQKRLYLINLRNDSLIGKYYVAHGQGSGDLYATRFSDKGQTHESSLGAFTVGSPYYGKHGRSLRINGLEQGVNDRVMSRAVVIHRAPYMTPSFIKAHGRAGRSWGCFALNPNKADQVMDHLPANTFLFAYAAQEQHDSHFTA